MGRLIEAFDEQVDLFRDDDNSHNLHAPIRTVASSESISVKPTLSNPATYLGTTRMTFDTGLARETDAKVLKVVDEDRWAFYKHELDVAKLESLANYLWIAASESSSRVLPARPLHTQLAIGRRIIITESAGLHLLWEDRMIYVKPLPDFLLCFTVWRDCLCFDTELHERASGFLLSYLQLVCHRSDLKIAHEYGLIPESIEWDTWVRFARSVSTRIDCTSLTGVSSRYKYGELYLSNLRWIQFFTPGYNGIKPFGSEDIHGPWTTRSYLTENIAWLATATVFIGLILTAMQVGLGTQQLANNQAFQNASYGFTVVSILVPLVIVALAAFFALLTAGINLWRASASSQRSK